MWRLASLSVVVCLTALPAVAGPMRDSQLTLGAMPRVVLDDDGPDPLAKALGVAEGGGFEKFRLHLNLSRNVTIGPVVAVGRGAPLALQGVSGASAMELGGFVEIAYDQFRFDGSLSGGAAGRDGFVADVGAAYQARLPGLETLYRVRVGTEWADAEQGDSYFSVNPALSAFGTGSDGVAGYRDISLAFSVTHAVTPSFYVAGTAGAKRILSEMAEGSGGADPNRFHLGAGLGFRF